MRNLSERGALAGALLAAAINVGAVSAQDQTLPAPTNDNTEVTAGEPAIENSSPGLLNWAKDNISVIAVGTYVSENTTGTNPFDDNAFNPLDDIQILATSGDYGLYFSGEIANNDQFNAESESFVRNFIVTYTHTDEETGNKIETEFGFRREDRFLYSLLTGVPNGYPDVFLGFVPDTLGRETVFSNRVAVDNGNFDLGNLFTFATKYTHKVDRNSFFTLDGSVFTVLKPNDPDNDLEDFGNAPEPSFILNAKYTRNLSDTVIINAGLDASLIRAGGTFGNATEELIGPFFDITWQIDDSTRFTGVTQYAFFNDFRNNGEDDREIFFASAALDQGLYGLDKPDGFRLDGSLHAVFNSDSNGPDAAVSIQASLRGTYRINPRMGVSALFAFGHELRSDGTNDDASMFVGQFHFEN